MFAACLLFLERGCAYERFIDNMANRLMTISLHLVLRPTEPAGQRGRDKFWKILWKRTPRSPPPFPAGIDPLESEGRALRDRSAPAFAAKARGAGRLQFGLLARRVRVRSKQE